MTSLARADALALRMSALLLGPAPWPTTPSSVADVVEWFGAMQAQDLGSGLWSLGLRLPGRTVADVTAALERREALRTWPMRGTVHLVPARDAGWMVELMAAGPLAGAARRREHLGLSERDSDRAVDVLGTALQGGGRLTRSACAALLADDGLLRSGNWAYHLLWYASQRGVTCMAPDVDGETTFALLDEWVPDPHRPDADEALGTLLRRYVRSHGPVRLQDFAGWTGLALTQTRRAAALLGDEIVEVDVDGTPMVVTAAALEERPRRLRATDVVTPPGFDEYLLGVKDRSLVLDAGGLAHVVPGGNGVFRATVVRAGRVVATWKKAGTPTRPAVDVTPLPGARPVPDAALQRAFRPYGNFLSRPLRVVTSAA